MLQNPLEILKRVRKIEIKTRDLVSEVFTGEYHSHFRGQGLEFSEVREYQPGDSYKVIDWNVSARFGHPFIKKFRETRELNVIFLVDCSASQQFGTRNMLKEEFIAEVTAVLSFSTLSNQDKVGLLLFSDKVEKYLPPRKGRKHTLQIIRDILFFAPQGKGTDLSVALSYTGRLLKKRSIIFIVSDFISRDYFKPLQLLAQKHDVIALKISDSAELTLPDSGFVRLKDPETGLSGIINLSDAQLRSRYERFIEQENQNFRKNLQKSQVDLINLKTDQPYVPELHKFFKRRRP